MRHFALLIAAVFAFTAFAATEHAVSDVVLGTPPLQRDAPALASDGENFLAVWNDGRGGESSLFAARVTASGAVLDPTGILLASPSYHPAHVLWNGERYLVFFLIGPTIMLSTVERDGSATAFRPLLDNASDMSVATNGSRIVIAYAGDAGSISYLVPPRPYVAVLDMNAHPLTNSSVDTFRDLRLKPSVAVRPNGEFVVAWNVRNSGGFELNALPLDANGGRKAFGRIPLGSKELETKLYANGDAFVAVSAYYSWGVSADLTVISAPQERPPGVPFELRGRAAIAGEDMPTYIGQDTPRRIEVAPFNAQGHVGAREQVLDAAPNHSDRLASISALQSGDHVLFAWATYHASYSELRLLASVADPDTLTPETATFPLTRSATSQSGPAVAAGATESLVAWSETDRIYAARIDDAGRRLDGRGILLSDAALVGAPRAAFHDGRYAVAFSHNKTLVVRFVTSDGVLLPESVRIPLVFEFTRAVLASGGGTLLLAWSDNGDIYATRVHGAGMIDPPISLTDDNDRWAVDPSVAWNGTHFLVAHGHFSEFDRTYLRPGIFARRVTPELALVGMTIVVAPETPFGRLGVPAVASNGNGWFVAWESVYLGEVHVAPVQADGVVSAKSVAARGFAPELAWNGKTMFLAYRSNTGVLAVLPIAGPGVEQRIDGIPKPTDPWPGFRELEQIGLAARNERWIAVYPRTTDASAGFVPRVFAAFTANQPRRRTMR